MKAAKRIVVVFALLLILGLVVVYVSLNGIVRAAVERQATASLNLPTKLGGASLAIFGGRVGLTDLKVGSPSTFTAPEMFAVGGTRVEVSFGQLRAHPIRITRLVIDRPKLVVEQANLKFNIQALMDQIPRQPEGVEPMKLIVDELQMNNATVVFLPGLPGLQKEMVLPIPSITLRNIGTGEGNQNGVAIKEVAMTAIVALAGKAGESGKLPLDLNTALQGDLGAVTQKLRAQANQQIKGLTDKIGKELPGDAGKSIDGLRNVLGGKKDFKNK